MTECPKCASEALVETPSLGNIPLDVCPSCSGIWFDKGELETLLKQSQGAVPASLELIDPKPEGLTCPRCKVKMSRGGLVNPLLRVDKCQSCGGVWLDPRELDLMKKLLGLTGGATEVKVERAAPAPEAPAPASPGLTAAKVFGWAAALAGLAAFSFELYLYFSPEGSVGHAPSVVMGGAGLLLLGGGIFTLNWID
ncbi:MAG: zf-TFIIB domain-containing protein [Elusimicrobia bacterium]|nr:zf-TFIIB domain-containing protein [Elusimicrobiota bacterium]